MRKTENYPCPCPTSHTLNLIHTATHDHWTTQGVSYARFFPSSKIAGNKILFLTFALFLDLDCAVFPPISLKVNKGFTGRR